MFDLSDFADKDLERAFAIWNDVITRDPTLWESGINRVRIREALRNFTNAYGEAIDINTVQNPYVAGGVVSPPAGAAYLDRGNLRPGMTGPGTAVNAAFASIGWLWGGRWASPDYQHFSKSGG